MQLYNFRGKKLGTDELVEGMVEAETEGLAVEILEEKGLIVIHLETKKRGIEWLEKLMTRVSVKDLVVLSRQLSVLISAQVPLIQALKDIARQGQNKNLRKVIAEVAAEVEGGVKFSEALVKFPKVFDNFFVNIVKSGESSGRLEEVLLYLADQLEKDYEMRSKIRGAMIYPAFIVSALLVLGTFMLVYIVPKLTEMLTQTGAALPLATRILIGLSDVLASYGIFILIGLVGLYLLYRAYAKTPAGRKQIDFILLKLPVFGKLYQHIAIIRFSRSLRTLLVGGVEIIEALTITSAIVGNAVYRDLILDAVANVENGGSISEVLEKNKLVPGIVSQMLRTGEETGKIDMVLEKISQFYGREVDNLIANLMSLLEPFIMVVLGLAVGVMIAAIVLPMYQMSSGV
jgi:type IV pilus assembly protein PilC